MFKVGSLDKRGIPRGIPVGLDVVCEWSMTEAVYRTLRAQTHAKDSLYHAVCQSKCRLMGITPQPAADLLLLLSLVTSLFQWLRGHVDKAVVQCNWPPAPVPS